MLPLPLNNSIIKSSPRTQRIHYDCRKKDQEKIQSSISEVPCRSNCTTPPHIQPRGTHISGSISIRLHKACSIKRAYVRARAPGNSTRGRYLVHSIPFQPFIQRLSLALPPVFCCLYFWVEGCAPPLLRGLFWVAQLALCVGARRTLFVQI